MENLTVYVVGPKTHKEYKVKSYRLMINGFSVHGSMRSKRKFIEFLNMFGFSELEIDYLISGESVTLEVYPAGFWNLNKP